MSDATHSASVAASVFDPLEFFSNWSSAWHVNARMIEISAQRLFGAQAIAAHSLQRLQQLVRHARTHSALYRKLYAQVPEHFDSVASLPVVDKSRLMANFDHWVTDPRITRSAVDAFMADPGGIGADYLGQYSVWHSSGSSGVPGIFIHDREAIEIFDALVRVQMQTPTVLSGVSRGMAAGGRAALIVATEGHFASVATARRMQRANPWMPLRVLPVAWSLEQLVAELNEFSPAFVSSYPTALALLAQARLAGQLKISPALLWCGGEYLSPAARSLIESAFGCPLVNEYGCSEALSIGASCEHGWLHLNADWALLEPVDRSYRPVPPGEISHTVLLTNLANRVAPIIRYDLGDSVLFKPERCACGSPLPAFIVEGRRADVIRLQAQTGRFISLPPLALAGALEGVKGVRRFQILQTSHRSLKLRLEASPGGSQASAWQTARASLRRFLESHGLSSVELELDRQPPTPDVASGKLHEVVAMHSPAPALRRGPAVRGSADNRIAAPRSPVKPE